MSSTSGKQQVHVECNQEGRKLSGNLMVEWVDAEHIKGSMVMTGEAPANINMKVSFETRWIAGDCGDVKPVTAK